MGVRLTQCVGLLAALTLAAAPALSACVWWCAPASGHHAVESPASAPVEHTHGEMSPLPAATETHDHHSSSHASSGHEHYHSEAIALAVATPAPNAAPVRGIGVSKLGTLHGCCVDAMIQVADSVGPSRAGAFPVPHAAVGVAAHWIGPAQSTFDVDTYAPAASPPAPPGALPILRI